MAEHGSVGWVAQRLGHVDLATERRGSGWGGHCNCGYRTTRRRLESEAISALVHHLRIVEREWRASGLALPTDTPTEPMFEGRTYRHVG